MEDAYNWTVLLRIVCWGLAFFFASWYTLVSNESPRGVKLFGYFCLLSGIIQTTLMVQWIALKFI